MKKERERHTDAADLRSRAEARLTGKRKGDGTATGNRMTAVEMQRLVQELQIHELELEMQNEELKKARDEAEAERERYLDLYDFAPVAYFTVDSNDIIRQVNLAGARLLGAERSRLLNRHLGNFVFWADRPAFRALLNTVFAKQSKENCDLSLGEEERRRSQVHVEASITGDGRECRIAVMDITERKKAEDELRNLHDELEERFVNRSTELEAANKELEAFCYTLSHDLRTPLRAIDGYSRMILRKQGDELTADTRTRFEIIRRNTQEMGQRLEDLLTFFRLGRRQLGIATVDVKAIVRRAWDELQITNPDRSMTLRIDKMPPGTGDGVLIKRVVDNLLSNAVKFAKSGDEIIVEAGGYAEGNEIVYYIKDNGIGFDMAYYSKLFGMFQQLHAPDEYEGTGVGLAIVRRIIQRHGGRVWAEGEPGKGATFFFSLPAPR